jgi:hypothetical protein
MSTINRLFLVSSLLFVPASSLFAQAAADPTGTWSQGPLTLPLTFTRAAK